MLNTKRERLLALKERITESTWCKGNLALNGYGDSCEVHSKHACRWCLLGHMAHLSLHDARDEVYRAFYARTQSCMLPEWQDAPNRTLADIHALLDDAIALCPS